MPRPFFRPPLPGSPREVLSVALPLIVNSAAFLVMQFSDRVFLARYSSTAIGAAMPAGILSFALLGFVASIAGYSGTFVAQYAGAGDRKACVGATMQGVYLSLLSLPFTLLLLPFGVWVLGLFGHRAELLAEETVYYRWMVYGGVFLSMAWSMGGYFTGQRRMRPNVFSQVFACAVNVALDYALIFGAWGFPRMGIRGAAIATFLAGTIPPLLQFGWMLRDRAVREMGWREAFRFRPDLLRRIVRFGFPAGVQHVFDLGSFAVFLLLTGTLDELSLTASNVAFSINNLAFAPLMSFGNAAAILAAQYQGAGRSDTAARAGWSGLRISWVYMAVAALAFVLLPRTLLSLFVPAESPFSAEQLFDRGSRLMLIMAAWGFFDAANLVFIGALRGVGDTRFVMTVLVGTAWLFWIPGEWILFHHGRGIVAAWTWQAIDIALCAILFLLRWRRGRWRDIRLIGA